MTRKPPGGALGGPTASSTLAKSAQQEATHLGDPPSPEHSCSIVNGDRLATRAEELCAAQMNVGRRRLLLILGRRIDIPVLREAAARRAGRPVTQGAYGGGGTAWQARTVSCSGHLFPDGLRGILPAGLCWKCLLTPCPP